MKISLLGLPVITSYGLRALIEARWPQHQVLICSDTQKGVAEAECYIVSASVLASMARFFMSRLDRVLLLTFSAHTDEPVMAMLSPFASEQDIYRQLEKLFSTASAVSAEHSHVPLTSREIDVIKLTAAGQTSRQIADNLCISTNTVLTHRKNIASKTGLHTVSAITHFAMLHGLLP